MANAVLIHSKKPGLSANYLADVHMSHPPVQYMGMIGKLRKEGHRVRVVDAYGRDLSVSETVAETLKDKPDVVGINGYICDGDKMLNFNAEVLAGIRRESQHPIKFVIGGPFVNHREYREKAIQTLKPHFTVVGEGEIPMQVLAEAQFDSQKLEGDLRVSVRQFEGSQILRSKERVNLDSIDIYWEPEWFDYLTADVDLQRFCLKACRICSGLKGEPTYPSAEKAGDLISYLYKGGMRDFFPIGPDLMADKDQITAIIEELLRRDIRGIDLRAEVCLDTLSETWPENEEAWLAFTQHNTFSGLVGWETAVPEILVNMKKVTSLEEAYAYLPKLMDLAEKQYPFNVWLYSIWVTHKSTPATVLFDVLIMKGLLKKYAGFVRTNASSITNTLWVDPGMPYYYGVDAVSPNWREDAPKVLKKLMGFMDDVRKPPKLFAPVVRWGKRRAVRKMQEYKKKDDAEARKRRMQRAVRVVDLLVNLYLNQYIKTLLSQR